MRYLVPIVYAKRNVNEQRGMNKRVIKQSVHNTTPSAVQTNKLLPHSNYFVSNTLLIIIGFQIEIIYCISPPLLRFDYVHSNDIEIS